VEPDGQHAVRRRVEFGLTALTAVDTPGGIRRPDPVIEIRSGREPRDTVILSEMSAFKDVDRVRVQKPSKGRAAARATCATMLSP
jgi:hypothetical protein